LAQAFRFTSIEPGVVKSDRRFTTTGIAAQTVLDFCRQAISAASGCARLSLAIEQPAHVGINEIMPRPTRQHI